MDFYRQPIIDGNNSSALFNNGLWALWFGSVNSPDQLTKTTLLFFPPLAGLFIGSVCCWWTGSLFHDLPAARVSPARRDRAAYILFAYATARTTTGRVHRHPRTLTAARLAARGISCCAPPRLAFNWWTGLFQPWFFGRYQYRVPDGHNQCGPRSDDKADDDVHTRGRLYYGQHIYTTLPARLPALLPARVPACGAARCHALTVAMAPTKLVPLKL